jgi:hypothetical protein
MQTGYPKHLPWFSYIGYHRYLLTLCTADRARLFITQDSVSSCRLADFARRERGSACGDCVLLHARPPASDPALTVTGFARAILFELTPSDPRAFAVAGAVLTMAALFAGWLPARRASHVDPLVALRHE